MINNYYIQKGTSPAVSIEDFDIVVMKTEGLWALPKVKKPFSRDYKDEQGIDVYIPAKTKFETKDVVLTFRVDKTSTYDAQQKMKAFIKYLCSGGAICYFDSFKKEGFRGFYDSQKINSEYFREYKTFIEFEMTFTAPNGICFGFDNSGQTSIFVNILSGGADFYFSDGTQVLSQTDSFIQNQEGGFVIVCPDELDGVDIQIRVNKIFVTDTGKLIVTDTGKLVTI